MAQKQKKIKSTDKEKMKKKSSGTRFNVDDPVNDIHDDELFEEETGLKKESSPSEEFERPW